MNIQKAFNSIELEKFAKLISEYFTADQIINLFEDLGYFLGKIHGTKWRSTKDWLEKIQNQVEGQKQVLNLLILISDPKYHFGNEISIKELITQLNLILKYRGIQIDFKGQAKFVNMEKSKEILELNTIEDRINFYKDLIFTEVYAINNQTNKKLNGFELNEQELLNYKNLEIWLKKINLKSKAIIKNLNSSSLMETKAIFENIIKYSDKLLEILKRNEKNKYNSKEIWSILSQYDEDLGCLLSNCIISEIECDDLATYEGRDAGIFDHTCYYAIIECPIEIYSFLNELNESYRKKIIKSISAFNEVDYFKVLANKNLHFSVLSSKSFREIKERRDFNENNQDEQSNLEEREIENESTKKYEILEKGLIFILMAMNNKEYDDLDDILKSIKNAVKSIRNIDRTSFIPKRIDDYQTTKQITPLILENIRKAEFIIADITHEKPNVFYEIGYAHAFKKGVIITAKQGTKLHFDIKDYQIIFYKDYSELENELKTKIKALKRENNIE